MSFRTVAMIPHFNVKRAVQAMICLAVLFAFLRVLIVGAVTGDDLPRSSVMKETDQGSVIESDDSVRDFHKRKPLIAQERDPLIGDLTEAKSRVLAMEFPEYLAKHKLYDTSAKKALMDLTVHLYDRRVPVPLFDNLVDGTTARKDPKICVFIASARRKGSPFSNLVRAVSGLLNRMNFRKYEKDVYIYVTLQSRSRCAAQGPILVEADVLATTDWVDSVLLALAQLEEKNNKKERMDDRWLMVRLYAARSQYPRLYQKGINYYDPLFSMVAVSLNKHHMLRYADELLKNVNEVLEATNIELILPKDLIPNNLASQLGLKMKAFEPVIFQHRGLYSSVVNRSQERGAETSWIMFSKYFDADGKSIEFNRDLWASQDSIISF